MNDCKSKRIVRNIKTDRVHVFRLVIVSLSLFFLAFTPVSGCAKENEPQFFEIDVPLLNAAEALNRLADQTGATFLFPYDVAASRQANPVVGRHTLRTALFILLENSGLSGGLSKQGAISITVEGDERLHQLNEGNNMIMARKKILSSVVGFLVAAGGAQGVLAQQENLDELLEEVVVFGSKKSNQLAIQTKSESVQIMDALSADDIGALPDITIGDSFRRIAGVNTLKGRSASSWAEYVVVRGLSPDFNNVTIDGMTVSADDQEKRRVNMNTIPSNMVSQLQVFKSQTADLDGNAISGNLNVVTKSAFDDDEMSFSVNTNLSRINNDVVPDEKGNTDKKINRNFSLGFNNTFGENNEFGVVASVVSQQEQFSDRRSDTQKVKWYEDENGDEFAFQRQLYSWNYRRNMERVGGAVKFEYQPSEKLYGFVKAFKYTLDEDVTHFYNGIETQGSSTLGNGDIFINSPTEAYARLGKGKITSNSRPSERKLDGVHAHIEYEFADSHTITGDISHSGASYDSKNNHVYFETEGNNENLGFTFDSSGSDPYYTLDNPAYFNNPANYFMKDIHDETKSREGSVDEVKVDYAFNADIDAMGWGAKAGLAVRRNTRDYDLTKVLRWRGSNGDQTMIPLTEEQSFIASSDPLLNAPLLTTYRSYFDEAVQNGDFDMWADLRGDYDQSTKDDYSFDETVSAAYIEAKYTTERFTARAGVRYERTKSDNEGINYNYRFEDGDFSELNYDPSKTLTDYSDVLPSASLDYKITDSLRLRLAYSQSIGRPDPVDTRANVTEAHIFWVDPNWIQISKTDENLKPRRSDNYDLSLEYYFDDGDGLASIAFFQKNIEDLIISTTKWVPWEAGHTWSWAGLDAEVRSKSNADIAEVSGFELNIVKNSLDFEFLPEAFHDIGFSANATIIDAKMEFHDDDELVTLDRLTSQPELISNVSVFYNILDRGEVRLAYNYTGDTSEDIRLNDFHKEKVYQAYETYDLVGRFDVSDHFTVTAQVRNLMDSEQEREWKGYDEPVRSANIQFARTYVLGLNYTF